MLKTTNKIVYADFKWLYTFPENCSIWKEAEKNHRRRRRHGFNDGMSNEFINSAADDDEDGGDGDQSIP